MNIRSLLLKLAATATAVLACQAVWAAPAWITLGDDALGVLRRMAPQAQVLASAQARVAVPVGPRNPALATRSETVHAVAVDDLWLEMLSLVVHQELQRCGGYVFHASEAAARAALVRLERQGGPQPLAVGPAPDYTLNNGTTVRALLPLLQGSHLMDTVEGLAAFQNRRYNSSHGVAASDWLAARWRAMIPGGRRDMRVVQIAHTGFAQKSVMFEYLGDGSTAQSVILGGHMDSIAGAGIETSRAPGADDNASGIAALTEVLRVLIAANYRPTRSLRFIAYAAEEVGLRGSSQIAADFVLRRDPQVVGVLQLDMTAFQGDSTDIWIYTDYTNAAQNQFLADLVAAYLPQYTVGYSACGYACSDHASWHGQGFRASFPHEASNANYNRAIHTPNDTTATFGNTPQHMLKFTQLALAYAVELGSVQADAAAQGAVARAR